MSIPRYTHGKSNYNADGTYFLEKISRKLPQFFLSMLYLAYTVHIIMGTE